MRRSEGDTMKYLVVGSGGPGFNTPEEALYVLENVVLPSFDQLIDLFRRPVVDRNLVAAAFDVQSQIFAHHCQANQTKITVTTHCFSKNSGGLRSVLAGF